MEQVNPIDEARRYVANALEIIEKSKYDPETKLYKDKKYVRIAGDTLWKGCLIALDAVFQVRKGKGRPSIEKYKEAVAKRDGKLLQFVNSGYETMHLYMGYDGNKDRKVCNAGFDMANNIIDRCALLYSGDACAWSIHEKRYGWNGNPLNKDIDLDMDRRHHPSVNEPAAI